MKILCKHSLQKIHFFECRHGTATHTRSWREVELDFSGKPPPVADSDGGYRDLALPEIVEFVDTDFDGTSNKWMLPSGVNFIESIWANADWEAESDDPKFKKKLYRLLEKLEETSDRTGTPTGFTEDFLAALESKMGLKLVREAYEISLLEDYSEILVK